MSILKTIKKHIVVALMLLTVMFLTGCATPQVADDLLVKTETLEQPLVNKNYAIYTDINPDINNSVERIDHSVKKSLDIALTKANIFSKNEKQFYRIDAYIKVASQARMSFGDFNGTLEIEYTVFDEKNFKIIEKTIFTEAGSDQWFFLGAKRHFRARAVNMAKNVLEFTDYLKTHLASQEQKKQE